MKTQREILEKIMKVVEKEPLTFMQLCRQSGFNYRTIKRQLDVIEFLQNEKNRIEIMRDGFRVVIKKPQQLSHEPIV